MTAAPDKVPVHLSGSAETLLLTLYGRAVDAGRPDPILGDAMAVQAVDRLDYDFARTRTSTAIAAAVAARAAFFDDWTRRFLADHQRATVLQLAAGLDSRPWRIDPGPEVDWYDVDFPEVIALRRELFPERARYTMIAASVVDDGWLDQVPQEYPVFVLAEGLTPYLEPERGRRLFRRLVDHFASGVVAVDVHSTAAIRMQRWNPGLRSLGAQLLWGFDDPHELERADPRLHLAEAVDALYAPHTERLPWSTRMTAALLKPFPRLRNLGMYVRYEFG